MTEVKKGTGKWKILVVIIVAFAFGAFLFFNLTTHTVEPLNIVAEPLAGAVDQVGLYIREPSRIVEDIQNHPMGYSISGSIGGTIIGAIAKLALNRKNAELLTANKSISSLITTQTSYQENTDLAQKALTTQLTDAQRRAELAEEKTLLTTQLMDKELEKKETQIQDKITEINTLNRTLAEKHVYEKVIEGR